MLLLFIKWLIICDWFLLSKPRVSNSRPAGLFRPATSFYVARESIWLSYKKKKNYNLLLYIIHYESAYQYHKFLFLFGVLFIRRNWLWCAYDTRWFFHWWRLRGRLKGIKWTSSNARAPPTEKHDILHSFNELKNRWKLSDTTFFSFFCGVILMTNVLSAL